MCAWYTVSVAPVTDARAEGPVVPAWAGLTAGAVLPLAAPPLASPAGAAGVVAVEPLPSPGTAAPPGPDPFADAGAGLTGTGTGLAAEGLAAGAEAWLPADGMAL